MRIGIVGMPGAGKTTLFRLLTGVAPSRKQDASIGMARVPDARIDLLSKMYQPKKTTYAQLEVVDLAGRASSGSTFDDFSSNKRGIARGLTLLINHMRNVDALVNVVRTFDSLELGEPNPLADASALTDELILADMAIAEARIERLNSSKSVQKRKIRNWPSWSDWTRSLALGAASGISSSSRRKLRDFEDTDCCR